MKIIKTVLFMALLVSVNSFAGQPPAPPAPPAQGGDMMQHGGNGGGMMQHGGGMHGGGMMNHGGGMMMDDTHLQAMQEHILKMHELSNQILAEKDPAKKEQLKQQQRDVMKAHHQQMMAGHGGMAH
jgi:hypothetical protein